MKREVRSHELYDSALVFAENHSHRDFAEACDLYLCARRKGKPYLSAVMQAIVFLLSAFLLVNLAVYVDEKGVEKYPWLSMQVVRLPAWLFVAAETAMILLCAVAIVMGYRSDKRHVSR